MLSLCREAPRVWGQDSLPKLGSSESAPPTCLTSSDGQAFNKGNCRGGVGCWGEGPEIASLRPTFGRENGESGSQSNHCTIQGRDSFAGPT